MPNPIDPFDLKVLTLPHFGLANAVITVADAISVHPGFQGTDAFPPTVPAPKELKETGTHYSVLCTAAMTGHRGKMAERDAFRPIAVQQLALTLTWAAMRSVRENDPSLIADLGVEHKKKVQSRSTSHTLVGAPKDPQVKHGPVSEMVLVSVGKVKGSVMYIVQACQGDPTREDSWTLEVQSAKCKGIEMRGLEAGKVYYFRVRCFCHAGHGPWSSIISLMVI